MTSYMKVKMLKLLQSGQDVDWKNGDRLQSNSENAVVIDLLRPQSPTEELKILENIELAADEETDRNKEAEQAIGTDELPDEEDLEKEKSEIEEPKTDTYTAHRAPSLRKRLSSRFGVALPNSSAIADLGQYVYVRKQVAQSSDNDERRATLQRRQILRQSIKKPDLDFNLTEESSWLNNRGEDLPNMLEENSVNDPASEVVPVRHYDM